MTWAYQNIFKLSLFGAIGGLIGGIFACSAFELATTMGAIFGGGVVGVTVASFIFVMTNIGAGRSRVFRQLLLGILWGGLAGIVGTFLGQTIYQFAPNGVAKASGAVGVEVGKPGTLFAPKFSPEIQQRLERNHAISGDVEFALRWDNRNDLDLFVIDPFGEKIFYDHRLAKSGGELDIDQNVRFETSVSDPIEHVYFRKGEAPPGKYLVGVNYFNQNIAGQGATKFSIEAYADDKTTLFNGVLEPGGRSELFEFLYGKDKPKQIENVERHSLSPWLVGVVVAFGWSVFGGILGLGFGVARKSRMAVRSSALAGVGGGMLGGIVLQLIGLLVLGPVGQVAGFAVLGASLGFSIQAIRQSVFSSIVLLSGKSEGMHLLLDRETTRLGSGKWSHFLLDGEGVETDHAIIKNNGGHYEIIRRDGELIINGESMDSEVLIDGDRIRLGMCRFIFRDGRSNTPTAGDWEEQKSETEGDEYFDSSDEYPSDNSWADDLQ